MSAPHQASEKTAWHIVTFIWGVPEDPNVLHVTDYTQAQADGTTISVPELEITRPPNTMTLAAGVWQIDVPITFEPIIGMSKGEPHTEVFVEISELARAPSSPTVVKERIFLGWVAVPIKNPAGKTSICRLECVDIKGLIGIPMGIPVLNQCVWAFGGPGCGFDVDSVREKTAQVPPPTVRIEEISNKAIRVSGLQNTATERYYHRGYVEVDGLRLGIRDHATTDWLELVARPPADWLLAEPIVTPGCDKTLATCRDKWSNEDRFLGLGIKNPALQPITEAE